MGSRLGLDFWKLPYLASGTGAGTGNEEALGNDRWPCRLDAFPRPPGGSKGDRSTLP